MFIRPPAFVNVSRAVFKCLNNLIEKQIRGNVSSGKINCVLERRILGMKFRAFYSVELSSNKFSYRQRSHTQRNWNSYVLHLKMLCFIRINKVKISSSYSVRLICLCQPASGVYRFAIDHLYVRRTVRSAVVGVCLFAHS